MPRATQLIPEFGKTQERYSEMDCDSALRAASDGNAVNTNDHAPQRGLAVLTSLLLAAQILIAAAAVALIPFQAMRTAVCDTQCDFVTASAAMKGLTITVAAILITTVVLLIVRRGRWAHNWPITLVGVVLTILAMVISNQIFIAALPTAGTTG